MSNDKIIFVKICKFAACEKGKKSNNQNYIGILKHVHDYQYCFTGDISMTVQDDLILGTHRIE